MKRKRTPEEVLAKMKAAAATEGITDEPVGLVLLYPDSEFVKAVWDQDTNREHLANALITASADELSKVK